MGLMTILAATGRFLFGAGGATATGALKQGADIVEKWIPGAEKKHEMAVEIDKTVADSVAQARQFAPVNTDAGLMGRIADGLSRLVRPVVTLYLLAVVFGLAHNAVPADLDPWYLAQAEKVLVFWFGGRLLIKDIPAAILYLRRGVQ